MLRVVWAFLIGLMLAGQTPWSPPAVQYKPRRTGTQTTTLQETFDRKVDVFDHLTPAQKADVRAGTKAVDVTAAIQSCFTNAPDGYEIVFRSGVYKISGSTALTRSKSGDIRFEAGASIDASSFTGANIIAVQGTPGTFYANAAAIVLGASTITVDAALAATLASGDMIQISTQTGLGGDGTLWYGGRSYYYKGELAQVSSVAGAVVTLQSPTRDAYAGGAAVVARIASVTTKITGFKLTAANREPTEQVGLTIKYGLNCEVEGGRIDGCSDTGLSIFYFFSGENR